MDIPKTDLEGTGITIMEKELFFFTKFLFNSLSLNTLLHLFYFLEKELEIAHTLHVTLVFFFHPLDSGY